MAKITDTRAIGDNAIRDEDILLDNNEYLRGRNNSNSADINILKINASDQVEVGNGQNMVINSSNVLPSVTGNNFGAASFRWDIYVERIQTALRWSANTATVGTENNTLSHQLTLETGDASATTTGDIVLRTGAATTDSGDIILQIGTAGGTRGKVRIVDGSLAGASVGYVWTLDNITTGEGSWTAAAGGIAWSDPVDADIVPDGNQTRDLGSAANNFDEVHAQTIQVGRYASGSVNFLSGSGSGAATAFMTGDSTLLGNLPSGVNANLKLRMQESTIATTLGIYSNNEGTANAIATGNLRLETGNKTAGTGDSGDIWMQTGTSAGGSRGQVRISAVRLALDHDMPITGRNPGDTVDVEMIRINTIGDVLLGGGNLTVVENNFFPNTSNSYTCGTGSKLWQNVISFAFEGDSYKIDASGTDSPSGVLAALHTPSVRNVGIYSRNVNLADATNTPNVYIDSGNISNAGSSGNSGDVRIRVGTNAGSGNTGNLELIIGGINSGTQGVFKFLRTGDAPTIGDVWTASAVDGTGYWAAPAGGNAWSDPVDSDILPPTLTYDIGAPTNRFSEGHFQTLYAFDIFQATSGNSPLDIGTIGNTITGAINIVSGNATAGNSGGVKLQTGTATGTRGKIQFVDGSEGTVGHYWVSQDTLGNGAWQAFAPSADSINGTHILMENNQWLRWKNTVGTPTNIFKLDNQVQTKIKINGAFLAFEPDVNNNISLGSSSFRWNQVVCTQVVAYSTLSPDADGGATIGNTNLRWGNSYIKNLFVGTTTDVGLKIDEAETGPGGATNPSIYAETGATGLNIFTVGQTAASTNTKDVRVETGNAVGATSDSGDIYIKTGTATQTRGNVILNGNTIQVGGLFGATLRNLVQVDASGRMQVGQSSVDWRHNGPVAPVSDGTITLGTTFLRWSNVSSDAFEGAGGLTIAANTTPSGTSSVASMYGLTNIDVALFTSNDATADANKTQDVFVETGNKTAGTGDSGFINIQTGTSAGGARGDIFLKGNRIDASASVGPMRMPNLAADPGAPANGDMWYNTTTNQLKARVNGSTVVLA